VSTPASSGNATAHTPGPWHVTRGHQTNLVRGVFGNNGNCVVRFNGIASPTKPEGQANARLIAAAPDLLAALIRLEEFTFLERWAAKGLDDDAQKVYDLVHAALSKAGKP